MSQAARPAPEVTRGAAPDAAASYYGRAVVKPPPWESDIATYLFAGGLAAGSSLLAAGADLTGRSAVRRTGRLGALVGLVVSMTALVHDLGRPARFLYMMRTLKLTSPMSVGTWILTLYGPLAGAAGAAELGLLPKPLRPLARPAGIGAALVAPAVASYTAVLLSDTAMPSWREARRELPFVFCGSAAAASGGLSLVFAPVAQAGPARRFALGGALVELACERAMEKTLGDLAEPLREGAAGRYLLAARGLSVVGVGLALVSGRSRGAAVLSGLALMGGSAATRFAVFEAGMASGRDPRYTVAPQRARLRKTDALSS